MEKSGFYRQGLPGKPHKLRRKEWEEEDDAGRQSPVETWRSSSGGGRVLGGLQCGCAPGCRRAGAQRGRGERSQRGGGSGWRLRWRRAGGECPVCTCGEAAAPARRREAPPPPLETQGRARLSRPPSPAQLPALSEEAGLRGGVARAEGAESSGRRRQRR